MAKKATPEQHVRRFLKAGGGLTAEQWDNMSARTRQTFLEGKELQKTGPAGAAKETFAAKEKKKP